MIRKARPEVSNTSGGRANVRASSGNVFADMGLPDADERLAKAELARQIGEIIAAGKMTQAQAAKALDIDQPKVSALLRGRLDGFSTERLIRFLNALGRDVEIVVRPRPAKAESDHHALRVVARGA